jgi:hypothetical protein
MKVWILKHKPSSMFYIRSRMSFHRKKYNLDKEAEAKMFTTKPNLSTTINKENFVTLEGLDYGPFVKNEWDILEKEEFYKKKDKK